MLEKSSCIELTIDEFNLLHSAFDKSTPLEKSAADAKAIRDCKRNVFSRFVISDDHELELILSSGQYRIK